MIISNLNNKILLPIAYFPPISYLKALLVSETIFIEQCENFIKKTYRNRCNIYAANGPLNLTVPVEEAARRKILVRDVRIDNSTNWQKQHFKSIESAYNSSPFFEYLIDDFMQFFQKKYNYLFDLNIDILHKIFEIMELELKIDSTESYEVEPNNTLDLRNHFQTKSLNKNPYLIEINYAQVFSEKYGFYKDLSCIDLFFNLGSEAYSYLTGNY